MKKIIVVFSVCCLFAFGCSKNQQVDQPNSFDGISIKGDAVCIQKTKEALGLLKQKSPTNYSDIKQYIGVVECAPANS